MIVAGRTYAARAEGARWSHVLTLKVTAGCARAAQLRLEQRRSEGSSP